MNLSSIFNPDSVVFIGESNFEPLIQQAIQNRFSGKLYIVSTNNIDLPNVSHIQSISGLDEPASLAIVDVPAAKRLKTIEALSKAGCGGAICIGPSAEGKGSTECSQELLAAADGMPVIGSGSLGLANFLDKSVFFKQNVGGTSEPKSGVALIAQGDTFLTDICTADRSLPVAYAVDVGSQDGLTFADIFNFMVDDERVTAIGLYLETISSIPALSRAALRAVRKGLPIVVINGGRTAADDVAVSALFSRWGFVECAGQEEALETLKMLVIAGRPLGRRIALSTNSSSYGLQGINAAEKVGLRVSKLPDRIVDALSAILPEGAKPQNPLNLQVDGGREREALDAFFQSEADMAVLVMRYPLGDDKAQAEWNETVDAFAKSAAEQQLPCAYINVLAEGLPRDVRESMIANGMAPLQGLQHGFTAISNAFHFVDQEIRLAQLPAAAIETPEPLHLQKFLQLDEAQGKAALAKFDVAVPKSLVIKDARTIDITDLSYPLVVKAMSSEMTHKTELGAVKLNIQSEDEVRQVIFDMNDWIEAIRATGYLIEEMAIDGMGELLIGIRTVPEIGQVLTMAVGGVSVELNQDATLLILPTSSSEIEHALRQLRLFPLLTGWRGKPAANIDKLVQTVAMIAGYAFGQRKRLYALEINPLIVRPDPHRPIVADVVIQLGKSEDED